jgi:long-chain fatty acid transport protein
MRLRRTPPFVARLALLALFPLLLVPQTPAFGAAFGIFEQGTKAMGMAGAFTAQADDPSALFHNAGGLAFVTEPAFSIGGTYIQISGTEFEGLAPFPGPGARGEMEDLNAVLPHVFYVRPINDRWKWGVGVFSPFGLQTEWKNPETFPGRFINQKAELTVIDVNPTIGWQASETFGIGFGIIGRFSEVELNRTLTAAALDLPLLDIAATRLTSDTDNGIGWNIGFLHKPGPYFSWGFSYRSNVEVEYGGEGAFSQILTGIPQIDAFVPLILPLDTPVPVETEIEFPDMASLGFAFGLTRSLLAEIDINWTGWSSFDALPLVFPTVPTLTSIVEQGYEDAYNYRLGFQYTTARGSHWRFGYVFDESPQPDEAVGPLLPDADRNGLSVGYGSAGGRWDAALLYLDAETRTTTTNRDGFNGTYTTDAFLVGLTVNF